MSFQRFAEPRSSEPVPKSDSRPANASWLRSKLEKWSGRSLERVWQDGSSRTPPFVSDAIRSPATPLDERDRPTMEARFGQDFSGLRIHADHIASASAERIGAAAYAAGPHIVFAPGQYAPVTNVGRHLLAHELAHVVQQRKHPVSGDSIPLRRDPQAEQDAVSWADQRGDTASPLKAADAAVMPSIAEKILKFAGKQLEKRVIKTVSKHIARHARRIAGRAIHSVFRNPREIRSLLEVAVREATAIAAKHPTAGTQHIIEEAGIRITRQATGTPGKFRLVIQKVFNKEIGTQGERVLRLVLDQTGRIVTAFPADRLAVIGLTAAGVAALTEGTARAGEAAQAQVAKADAAQKEREDRFDFWDWVPLIGDIWGGSLNEGEDEMLRQDREITTLIQETIADVEQSEKRTLGMAERKELEQLIRAAIASPLITNDSDVGEP